MGVVVVAGAQDLIEDVPVPEFAVAAEVELTGAGPPTGIPMSIVSTPMVDLRLTARGQGADPFGRQFLVERDELPSIFGRERPGDEGRLGDQGHAAESDEAGETRAGGE